MTDERFDPVKERTRAGQNLTAIEDMYARLHSEAINRAGDPSIPGGTAMVLLGPGADVEAFGYAQMSELFGRTKGVTEVALRGDLEPPLAFLAGWADIVRDARGQEPSQRRARIGHEIRYLRSALDWILATDDDGDPWWVRAVEFTDGLKKVRTAMENALKDGTRAERINAECRRCEKRVRLIVMKGDAEDGSKDWWRCPECNHGYDADGVRSCWHQMFVRRGDAPEWVSLRKAAAALNRPPTSVREWALAGKLESEKRDDGQLWVRWSDARALNETVNRRRRKKLA